VPRRLSEIRADLKLARARTVAATWQDKAKFADAFMELTIEAIDALCLEIQSVELTGTVEL